MSKWQNYKIAALIVENDKMSEKNKKIRKWQNDKMNLKNVILLQ